MAPADHEQKIERTQPPVRDARRRVLLAKIHIAVKELGMSDGEYRTLLRDRFGVSSAARLSTEEMETLLDRFVRRGWRPKGRAGGGAAPAARRRRRQVFALQSRARRILSQLDDGDERRLQGLCEKICGSGDLASCRDVKKLRRILAVLEGIRKSETGHAPTIH
jgi:hypothetical protein